MSFNIVFVVFMAACVAVAWSRGGRDERIAASAMVIAAFATPFVARHAYAGPEAGVIIVDVCLLAVLAAIARRSRAFWPLWITGFQLAALAVHVAVATAPHIKPLAYADTLTIWAYIMLGTVALGSMARSRPMLN